MNEQPKKQISTSTQLFIVAILLLGVGITEATITSGGGQTTISYTMSNAQAVEVGNAFAWAYQYKNETCTFNQDTALMVCVPNTETISDFTDKKIKQYVKDVVIAYRQSKIVTTVNTTVPVN